MTPPPPLQPDDPKAWLRRAQSNLAYARHEVEGVLYEDRCFNAQQAVEKSLKALLLRHRVTFPFTHDIAVLLTLVETHVKPVPQPLRSSAALTDYAVSTRYPGVAEPVTRAEYLQAVDVAAAVVAWVSEQLAKPS